MEKPFKKILEDLMELEKIDARTKVFKKKSITCSFLILGVVAIKLRT